MEIYDPQGFPIIISKGATFTMPVTYEDEETELPIDITSYHAQMQIRKTPDASGIVVNLTDSNGGILINGTLGRADILITSTQSGAFTAPWCGVYDLLLISPAGVVDKILFGSVKIEETVTQ